MGPEDRDLYLRQLGIVEDRAFDPREPRDPHGRWSLIGQALSKLVRRHREKNGRSDLHQSVSALADEAHGLNQAQRHAHMRRMGLSHDEATRLVGSPSDVPRSMSDLAHELSGLGRADQRAKLKGWGFSPRNIDELLGATESPASMSDAAYELDGLPRADKIRLMKSWGWSQDQINSAL